MKFCVVVSIGINVRRTEELECIFLDFFFFKVFNLKSSPKLTFSEKYFEWDISINPIHTTGFFQFSTLKISEKTSAFLMFSGGIERDQWHDTG